MKNTKILQIEADGCIVKCQLLGRITIPDYLSSECTFPQGDLYQVVSFDGHPDIHKMFEIVESEMNEYAPCTAPEGGTYQKIEFIAGSDYHWKNYFIAFRQWDV
jgi:hypothetical protein